ncbi:MAG: sigma-70 family RNA polymerase sigma factor [Planctomycetes bacterium]|nr:sigma-70 family RNA polymerase sigma factor [Planctomycetota bacterium]
MAISEQATTILARLEAGDASAADHLLALVYEELRALAGSYFRNQSADHTLQPTALVHEVFLKLIDQTSIRFNDRGHFFAVAATAMRQILTDHARRARAAKRGGASDRVGLETVALADGDGRELIDIIALDDALTTLAKLDSRQHRVVELRFFGGLTVNETAEVIGASRQTVELDWRAARAWLNAELSR